MKFNKKEIKKLALSNMQYRTYDPLDAVILAVEMWMTKKELMVIPKLPTGKEQGPRPQGEA